jgi:hypothetical protein
MNIDAQNLIVKLARARFHLQNDGCGKKTIVSILLIEYDVIEKETSHNSDNVIESHHGFIPFHEVIDDHNNVIMIVD